jgi:uncharacterized protein (DUF302 family)
VSFVVQALNFVIQSKFLKLKRGEHPYRYYLFHPKPNPMSYFITRITNYSFDKAVDMITQALQTEGFGVLTEIDVKATLKSKLNVDFKKYKILGACNPKFAYEALQVEDKIGTLMPCNVTVIELENGTVEISIMDPTTALNVVENEELQPFAIQIKQKMQRCLTLLEKEESTSY